MTAQPLDYPHIAPSRPRAILFLAALFTFFLAAYAFTASADFFSTGDTTIRIEVAENILGRWSVDFHGWKLQYALHQKKEFLDPRVSVGRNGKVYTTYLLGQPLAIIPLDYIGSRLAVHERWPFGPTVLLFDRLVGPIFGALEVLLFFVFSVRLGYGVRRSLALCAIFGFATCVWPDEQSVLEHTIVAFFLLLAMYGAYRYREQYAGNLHLVLAGIGIGGAAITRYQDAFLGLLGVGLYLVLPGGPYAGLWERVKRLLVLGIGLAPFVVLDLWYSWVRFGSPFASGHHETVFGYLIWKGALGLTISPGKGLLWYCPVIALLVLAGPRFARRLPALSLAMAVTCVSFILLYGYVTYWHGDPAWGPRYLYGALPFFILPLGEVLRWRGRWTTAVRVATAGIVLISFVVQFSAVTVSPWRSWYRVISYEENQGYKWDWIAARYRYHWNIHESPLNFQIHGLYQLAYDGLLHSHKYELVPPQEDPILDDMTLSYAINQWNLWWKSDEFDWWMGQQKIIAAVVTLLALMCASGLYLAAEAGGLFDERTTDTQLDVVSEAA
ncbi:MAG: hypothetical protein NVSMB52_16520 [Chloroflexota bacterium]